MKKCHLAVLVVSLLTLTWSVGCVRSSDESPVGAADACMALKTAARHLIPGPGEPGYDPELDALAQAYWTQFRLFNSHPFAMALDVAVKGLPERQLIEDFFHNNPSGLTWEQFSALYGGTGQPIDQDTMVSIYGEVGDLGMFGGVAAAGEAWRYIVLRDVGGGTCAELEDARQRLITLMESLHIQTAITGRPGSVARGIRPIIFPPDASGWGECGVGDAGRGSSFWPMTCDATVLANGFCCANAGMCCSAADFGDLLPTDKYFEGLNKARWRRDASGEYPDWIWLDECSKDQFDGWVMAIGAVWEAVHNDPYFPQWMKDRMQDDARKAGDMLMTVAPETGLDLSIRDGDGHLSTHHDLNPREMVPGVVAPENSTIRNGFNALMSFGMIKVVYYITGDEKFRAFYYDELLGNRKYDEMAATTLNLTDMGFRTNYSSVNMAFVAYYDLIRYESDPVIRKRMADILDNQLWDNSKNNRQVKDINQSFFDFMYAGFRWQGTDIKEVDEGIRTLQEFPEPPFFNDRVMNCDATEIANGLCLSINGVETIPLATWVNGVFEPSSGRNGDLVADTVIPRRIRPHSNFDWRSNPFSPNGGGGPFFGGEGSNWLLSGGDFLAAYWMGRMLEVSDDNSENVATGIPVYVAPAAPLNLAAVPYSETQIHLTWTDGSNNEKGFVVERRRAGWQLFQPLAQLPAETTVYEDILAQSDSSYEYRVQAFNDMGWSPYSNVAAATTPPAPASPPAAPTNLVIWQVVSANQVVISWDDNSGDEQGFIIQRDGVAAATTLANVIVFSDSGLTSGTTYNYEVIAFNSAGNSAPSNTAQVTTPSFNITALFPADQQSGVTLTPVPGIQVGFSDPITLADITEFSVNEAFLTPGGDPLNTADYVLRPVTGTFSLDGTGTVATFVPDVTLSMTTTHFTKVAVNLPPPLGVVTAQFSFFTTSNTTVDLASGLDKGFEFGLTSAALFDPPDLQAIIGLLGNFSILLGMAQVDVANNTFNFIGATSDNPPNQKLTDPTLFISENVDLSNNPLFEVPAAGQPGFLLLIPVQSALVPFTDVRISGVFHGNYEYIAHGQLKMTLDMGTIGPIIGTPPSDLCNTLLPPGTCQACPNDPGRIECINLIMSEMRANALSTPLVPVAAPLMLDQTLAGTIRTIEVSLKHPRSGAVLATASTPITVTLTIDPASNAVFVENGLQSIDVLLTDTGPQTVTLSDADSGSTNIDAVITNPAVGACSVYTAAGNSCIPDPTGFETEVVVSVGQATFNL